MLRAGRGERVPRPPMWAMRQAGRYLPEFLALRNYGFLERVHTPELAAEITLQPLRRYADRLDAVVIFSDILIVPPAMGLPVYFRPGPQFGRLLESPADLDGLNWKPDVHKEFRFLLDSISLTRRLAAAPTGTPIPPAAEDVGTVAGAGSPEGTPGRDQYWLPRSALPPTLLADMASGAASVGKAVPVIGFCGAAWTLMSYMIDGDLAPAPEAASAAEAAAAAPAAGASGAAGAPATIAGSKAGERGLVGHKTYERSKRWLYHVSRVCTAFQCAAAQAGITVFCIASPHIRPPSARSLNEPSSCCPLPSLLSPLPLQHPDASHRLLSGIADILVDLLVAQWEAGADILQVFETNGEALPPARFREFALPYLLRVAAGVRARTAPVSEGGPVLSVFAKGAHACLAELADPAASAYDVISLDWSVDPAQAVRVVREAAAKAAASGSAAASAAARPKALQGNLDPCELFGSGDSIAAAARTMLAGFGDHPLIANLGHGMLPGHKPEALRAYFDAIHAHAY